MVLDHPGPHPPPVKLDPDPAAYAKLGIDGSRDGVVEPSVDGRHVRHHPDHPDGDVVRYPGCVQSPSACFTSCAREVSSQVNSLSERPK